MARTSKKSPPSRQRDRARHEADVLAAAERLFGTRGFAATTIAEVAGEAGFSVATLYNLFGSKEAILERLLTDHFDAMAREIGGATDQAPDPRAKLHATVLTRARYCESNRAFFTIFAESYSALKTPEGREPAPKERAVAIELVRLEKIFKALPHARLDASTRALVFYGATRAFVVERVLRARKPARPADVTKLVDSLLDGLGPGR